MELVSMFHTSSRAFRLLLLLASSLGRGGRVPDHLTFAFYNILIREKLQIFTRFFLGRLDSDESGCYYKQSSISDSSWRMIVAEYHILVLGCVVNRFVLYYANVKKGCRENGECIRTT